MDVKCFTNNEGKRFILTDDCKNIIATQCASATGCACDPSRCPQARALTATLNPNGRRFNSLLPTIGDLVNTDRKVGASQERSESIRLCPDDSACRRLHETMGLQCSGLICKVIASLNQNGADHFDPWKYTVGDLVGSKTVEAAASSPPVTRRINGKLDLTQPTVGDLVQGHTSIGQGPLMGGQNCERIRSPFVLQG